jgi:L-ascorbate metabolism protein UlaG (beta-lactamase superfamily)
LPRIHTVESASRREELAVLNTRGNKITWLGHSAFRLTTASGKVLLIDPFLKGNPLCPENGRAWTPSC